MPVYITGFLTEIFHARFSVGAGKAFCGTSYGKNLLPKMPACRTFEHKNAPMQRRRCMGAQNKHTLTNYGFTIIVL